MLTAEKGTQIKNAVSVFSEKVRDVKMQNMWVRYHIKVSVYIAGIPIIWNDAFTNNTVQWMQNSTA